MNYKVTTVEWLKMIKFSLLQVRMQQIKGIEYLYFMQKDHLISRDFAVVMPRPSQIQHISNLMQDIDCLNINTAQMFVNFMH